MADRLLRRVRATARGGWASTGVPMPGPDSDGMHGTDRELRRGSAQRPRRPLGSHCVRSAGFARRSRPGRTDIGRWVKVIWRVEEADPPWRVVIGIGSTAITVIDVDGRRRCLGPSSSFQLVVPVGQRAAGRVWANAVACGSCRFRGRARRPGNRPHRAHCLLRWMRYRHERLFPLVIRWSP